MIERITESPHPEIWWAMEVKIIELKLKRNRRQIMEECSVLSRGQLLRVVEKVLAS